MLARKIRGLKARAGYMVDRFRPKPEPVGDYQYGDLVEVVFRKTVALDGAGWASVAKTNSDADKTLVGVATAASRAGQRTIHVLDHGGACGFHYQMVRRALPHVNLKWAVLETKAMAARAKELETGSLAFFDDLRAARSWLGSIDLIHSSGTLQCFPSPIGELNRLTGLKADVLLWARMDFSNAIEQRTRHTKISEHGAGPMPGDIQDATVTINTTSIPEASFMTPHNMHGYRLNWRFGSTSPAFLFTRD